MNKIFANSMTKKSEKEKMKLRNELIDMWIKNDMNVIISEFEGWSLQQHVVFITKFLLRKIYERTYHE